MTAAEGPESPIESPAARHRSALLAFRAGRARSRGAGQATTEYLILGMLIAIALVIGEPSPLEELFRAIQTQYGRFTMALSLP